jgi:hypothetical protein
MPSDRPNSFEPFAGLPVATLAADENAWQVRFLASPLLQRLRPLHWQQLLQGMTAETLAAGATLVEAGTAGDACFVLQSGRARVHRGARTLAVLAPGALFGEDALITGSRRNASVSLLEPGRVGCMAAPRFEAWLLTAVIRPLGSPGARRLLCIAPPAVALSGSIHLPLARIRDAAGSLDAGAAYCVAGGTLRERWLAAFVLAQQGFDALPLDDAPAGDTGPPCTDG